MLEYKKLNQSHLTTDGESVCLGVEPHLELMTRFYSLSGQLLFCLCRASSLTRGLSLAACHRQLQRLFHPSLVNEAKSQPFASVHVYMTLFAIYTRRLSVQALSGRLCII
jgi:hypothetical protein